MPPNIVSSSHRRLWRTVLYILGAVIVSHFSPALAISHEWGLRFWLAYGNLPPDLAKRESNFSPILKHLAEIDRLTAANQIDAAYSLLLNQTPTINKSSGIWSLPIGHLPESLIDLQNLPAEKSLDSTAAFLMGEFASKNYVAKYLLADFEQWVGSELPVSKGLVDRGWHWVGWPRIFLTDVDGIRIPLDSVSSGSDPTILLVKKAAIVIFRKAYLESIWSTFNIGNGQPVPAWFRKLILNQQRLILRQPNSIAHSNKGKDLPRSHGEVLAIPPRVNAGEISLNDGSPPQITSAASCESLFKGPR